MTIEEARNNAEVMMAYVKGNKIEVLCDDGEWGEIDEPDFDFLHYKYRVKKVPSYRPFKDEDECFNEMKKHSPFGWVYEIKRHNFSLINEIDFDGVFGANAFYNFDKANDEFTFVDGTPFGIKE